MSARTPNEFALLLCEYLLCFFPLRSDQHRSEARKGAEYPEKRHNKPDFGVSLCGLIIGAFLPCGAEIASFLPCYDLISTGAKPERAQNTPRNGIISPISGRSLCGLIIGAFLPRGAEIAPFLPCYDLISTGAKPTRLQIKFIYL